MKGHTPATILAAGICLLMASPCSGGQSTPLEPAGTVRLQEKDAVGRFCYIVDQLAAETMEAHRILKTIKDKGTADTAARYLEACQERMLACQPESEEAYNQLCEAAEKQGADLHALMQEHYNAKVALIYGDLQALITQLPTLDPPYYGSEALKSLAKEDSILSPTIFLPAEIPHVLKSSELIEQRITALLSTVVDPEEEDEVAADVAELCFCQVINILYVEVSDDESLRGETYVEATQKLYAVAKRILEKDTLESGPLHFAFWGLRYLCDLKERGVNLSEFDDYLAARACLLVYSDNLSLSLEGIEEAAGVDKALADVAHIVDCIRSLLEEEQSIGKGIDKKNCEEWLALARGASREKTEKAIRKSINDCANLAPPYFGSKKLEATLKGLKLPSSDSGYDALGHELEAGAVTKEQIQTACRYMDRALDPVAPIKEILQGVKDKETADAAAPRVLALRGQSDAVWDEMAEWLDSVEESDALGEIILEMYEDRLREVDELYETIAELRGKKPSCYGSEALGNALMIEEETAGYWSGDTSTSE